jgi:hypothetical protein
MLSYTISLFKILGKIKMGSLFSICQDIDPPFDRKIKSVIEPLVLSDDSEKSDRMKRILNKRFVSQVLLYEYKATRVGRRYNTLRFIVTVGSMILPTLQTIQSDPKVDSIEDSVFWAAIGTSLTVMVANGMIQMFGFDKKYTIYHLAVEKMKAIGWQWLERSGKYSMNEDGSPADYCDNWAVFWNDLEKVKSLTVGSIYGGEDQSGGMSGANTNTNIDNIPKETPRPTPRESPQLKYTDVALDQVNMIPDNYSMLDSVRSKVDSAKSTAGKEVEESKVQTEKELEEELERNWQIAFQEEPNQNSTQITPPEVPPLNLNGIKEESISSTFGVNDSEDAPGEETEPNK